MYNITKGVTTQCRNESDILFINALAKSADSSCWNTWNWLNWHRLNPITGAKSNTTKPSRESLPCASAASATFFPFYYNIILQPQCFLGFCRDVITSYFCCNAQRHYWWTSLALVTQRLYSIVPSVRRLCLLKPKKAMASKGQTTVLFQVASQCFVIKMCREEWHSYVRVYWHFYVYDKQQWCYSIVYNMTATSFTIPLMQRMILFSVQRVSSRF